MTMNETFGKKGKQRHAARGFGVLLAMLLLSACGEEESEEIVERERVREESPTDKEESTAEGKEGSREAEGTGKAEDAGETGGYGMAEEAEDGSDELREALLKKSGETEDKLQSFEYDDFDGDGTHEAFALIGEQGDDYGDDPVVEGALWFVSPASCELLGEAGGMGYSAVARTMEIGGTVYVMFDELYVTEAVTKVWYVSDGPKEAAFSGCGNVVTPTEDESFCIMKSSYDAFLDPEIGTPIGHTWKYYYFFYNSETGEVNEYAGTGIDADTVTFLCGRDLTGELMSEKDTIDSIFCRGNGHIVINYEYNEDGTICYEHYIYDHLKGHFVDDYGQKLNGAEAQSGSCAPAICPGIASYPEVPGPGDTVWYGE